MNISRRHLLAVAATASIAGCLGSTDPQPSVDGAIPEAATYVEDGMLDYVGLVDGAADTSYQGNFVIEYTDPEERFEATVRNQDELADGENLRVSTDLSTEAPTTFPAPVYDAESERFLIHVFANDEFVSVGEWEARIGPSSDPQRVENVVFEALTPGVQYTVVDPEGTLDVAIIAASESDPSDVSVRVTDSEQPLDIPPVSFEFNPNGEALTITHGGGEPIPADQLSISVGGERVDAMFDADPVVAGSSATLDDTDIDGQTVRIILESEDDSRSRTLGEFHAP